MSQSKKMKKNNIDKFASNCVYGIQEMLKDNLDAEYKKKIKDKDHIFDYGMLRKTQITFNGICENERQINKETKELSNSEANDLKEHWLKTGFNKEDINAIGEFIKMLEEPENE